VRRVEKRRKGSVVGRGDTKGEVVTGQVGIEMTYLI